MTTVKKLTLELELGVWWLRVVQSNGSMMLLRVSPEHLDTIGELCAQLAAALRSRSWEDRDKAPTMEMTFGGF